jgi:hypothetical protein
VTNVRLRPCGQVAEPFIDDWDELEQEAETKHKRGGVADAPKKRSGVVDAPKKRKR